MAEKMFLPVSLLDRWTQENDELTVKCKQERQNALCPDQNHTGLRWCSSEFHKLARKIQGTPPHADYAQLELSVVYNVCMCFVSQSQFTEAELLLKQAIERVQQMTEGDSRMSVPVQLWRSALKYVENTALYPFVLRLLCVQWAIWLANCQFKTMKEFQKEISSLLETLNQEKESLNQEKEKSSNVPKLVMDPRRLVELLQISTAIAEGAEKLNEGQGSEVLPVLREASDMPAPRALISYTHLLSGSCLAHMNRPQMALQCYRQALETDSRCVCALYQSTLVYRQLGNTQAEIQALRILHSTLLLPSTAEPSVTGIHLSPSLLLRSQSLSSLLSVPSALSVLHSLALKCVLYGRVSEGVQHYLDLLAALHSEDQQGVYADVSTLPKLPKLYLEAGTALLMAQQPTDCMALCSEVISTTLELLPDRVVLEEPEESGGAETEDEGDEGQDRVAVVLWVAAAYLLQAHCYTHTREWKQAVTHYTRCINLLVKVLFKKKVTCFQPQSLSPHTDVKWGMEQWIVQRLKGLSLAGRGISFTQMDHMKEALRDLQLSSQVLPEGVGAGLWCGEVLWKLGRRHEAAACWKKTWSLPKQSLPENLPLYVREEQWSPTLDSTELRHKIQELDPL
ncbi:unnamed protein product [Menidia menidia]|uniref:(Atlantic silverside) hypothetical protein n=1 Tax=Menidia menidia TaxID=238744 RepID=A0A8S4B3H1_9TELE|nr:unnamed protein product [Menidia menidia]